MDTDLCRLHGIELIVDGRRRAGQIENLVDFDIERKTDIVSLQFKKWVRQQVLHVVSSSGVEVVNAQHFITARQQSFTQVCANKPGPASYKNATPLQHNRTALDVWVAITSGRACPSPSTTRPLRRFRYSTPRALCGPVVQSKRQRARDWSCL